MFYYFNAEMKYYEKPAPPVKPFATATDQELADMLDNYYNDLLTWQDLGWSVGDTRLIHLDSMQAPNPNSSQTWPAQDITLVIVDHDHTDLATPINGHNKACITVQTRECLNNNSQSMAQLDHIYVNGDSSDDFTFNKWANLYMRSYLNNIVWGAFPSTLKSSIKPSNHYRHTTHNGTESEQVTDNLFLPSYPEIFGTESYSNYAVTNPVEGIQFEYFKTAPNRIKYGNDNGVSNGVAQFWWNGSPCSYYRSEDGYRWLGIKSTNGNSDYNKGTVSGALVPAFAM